MNEKNFTTSSYFHYLFSKEYEKVKKNHLFHACLGGATGFFMESCLYPIDTARTRMKANTSESVALLKQMKAIHKYEGFYSFFRGYSCILAGSFAVNSTYFYVYEKLKHSLTRRSILSEGTSPFVAAFTGGFISNCIALPFMVIKTRMQLKTSYYDYEYFLDGLKKIWRLEGPTKLYLGAPVFFTQAALETGLTFGFYEFFHNLLSPFFRKKELNLSLSIASSVSAAAVTGVIINPLDVLVTRIQTFNTEKNGKCSIPDMVKMIYKNEGLEGFMKGVSGTISVYTLGALILFPTYEAIKATFNIDSTY